MRREFIFALVASLPAAFATAQQSVTPTGSPIANTPPTATAYFAGPGITAPELIPYKLTDIFTGHCDKLDGVATLTAVVDTQGIPVQIVFLHPNGNGIDKMAAHMVSLDRFNPGTRDGTPAAVVISDEIKLQTCIERQKNESGKSVIVLHLRSEPDQTISAMKPPGNDATVTFVDSPPSNSADSAASEFKSGNGVNPPVVIHSVGAEFSNYARENHTSGVCLVTLIVDEHGLPQDLRVTRSLEPSLDQNALKAVSQYRFKPATKNGVPIPVRITIEIDFRL